MPKTAVGLFKNRSVADEIVHEIEALGFPGGEVRTVAESLDLAVTGVMSMPHLDFELELARQLMRIGATKSEAEAYMDGIRQGGVLVLATGEDGAVDAAAAIMARRNGLDVEEVAGPEPRLPGGLSGMSEEHSSSIQAGRVRYAGDSVGMFVW